MMRIKSRNFRILSFVMLIVLWLTMFTSVQAYRSSSSLTDETVERYEAQLTQLEKEKAEIQARINSASAERWTAYENLEAYKEQIRLIGDEIIAVTALLEEYNKSIVETVESISEQERALEEKYEQFKTRLRTSYEDGNASFIEVLLDSHSIMDFLVRVERIGQMLEYDKLMMSEISNELQTLESSKSDLILLQQKAESKMKDLEKSEAEYQTKVEQTTLYYEKVQKSEAQYKSLLIEVNEDLDEFTAELDAYIKELEAKNAANYVGGEFIWPTELDHTYISSYFGWRNLYGVRNNHYGIDIPCDYKDNIYASNTGTVVKAQWNNSYGYYIMLDHGGGTFTLYAHNTKLLVNVGDKVQQGDVIALAGTTGNSYGVHCHFEIWKNNARTDPLDTVVRP